MMDDTAAELEAELQQQLEEQTETLSSINEALLDGHDEELFAVKQQLEEAIPALQQSLAEIRQHVQVERDEATNEHQHSVKPVPQAITAAEAPAWLAPGVDCRYTTCCCSDARSSTSASSAHRISAMLLFSVWLLVKRALRPQHLFTMLRFGCRNRSQAAEQFIHQMADSNAPPTSAFLQVPVYRWAMVPW